MDFLMEAASKAGNPLMQFLPMILIMFAIMYFLIIRPQRTKEKRRVEMIANVRKNDRIVTIGGVHGLVLTVKEKDVIVRVDDAKDVKLKIEKSAITTVSIPKNEQED